MKTTPEHNQRIAKMTFASVYPHYITKVEKKGRTKAELHEVIEWLTGYTTVQLEELITNKVTCLPIRESTFACAAIASRNGLLAN